MKRLLSKVLSEAKMLEFFPPFLFMGAKVRGVSKDYRKLHVTLPCRWYALNHHGTLFGGFLCAVADPLPSLLCSKIFPGHEVWTKANCVDFLRPARGILDIHVEITEADVEAIKKSLAAGGRTIHVFEFAFRDNKGKIVAEVKNSVFIRRGSKKTGFRSSS